MVSVHLFAALLPAALLLGFMLGFAGYAQARRRAFVDLLAAQQRKRAAMTDCRQ